LNASRVEAEIKMAKEIADFISDKIDKYEIDSESKDISPEKTLLFLMNGIFHTLLARLSACIDRYEYVEPFIKSMFAAHMETLSENLELTIKQGQILFKEVEAQLKAH
jgi:hypothetical protein